MMKEAKRVVYLLVIAIIVMVVMLLTDDVLWRFAPSHAYGVIGFIVIDLILILWIASNPSGGVTGTLVWSTLQFLAMVFDPLTANVTDPITGNLMFGGFSVEQAFNYLYFDQIYYTFDILLMVLVVTIALSYQARGALQRSE